MSKVIVDPLLYEKLNKPFKSAEKAERMLNGFWNELRALRKKYKIPNVICVYQLTFQDGNDDKLAVNHMSCGDSRLVLPLLKIAYEKQYAAETKTTEVNLRESLVLLLATCGLGTIKDAREFLKEGNVKINDEVVTEDCEVPEGAKVSFMDPETGEWKEYPGKEEKSE